MSFRVFWSPHAEERLESILRAASHTFSLTLAAKQIDRYLAAIPGDFGESRYDTVRVGFVPPLGVQFEVMDDVRTVIVYDVWRLDKK
jgi:plasmid stabilization system protein ParE